MKLNISINFQSQHLTFSDWVSLLTLCLAPLIVHILAGVPAPTCFNRTRPRWHDLICHYNPTSIFWRYLAITDRRCRAKSWSPLDMAATNALFWTQNGWDGSEEMIQRSQDFCIEPPNKNRISFVSLSMVLTLIVALQGGQALYSLISGFNGYYPCQIAVGTIFYQLATLGLLRLPAALWLTNDFVYTDSNAWTSPAAANWIGFNPVLGPTNSALLLKRSASSLENPIILSRFHSGGTWRSASVKCFYQFLVTGAFVTACVMTFYDSKQRVFYYTVTEKSLGLLFIIIYPAWTLQHHDHSLYHWEMVQDLHRNPFASTLLVFTFAALETRRAPCGKYTTFPMMVSCDETLCGPSRYIVAALQQNTNETFDGVNETRSNFGPYGLAFPIERGVIKVLFFDGWCIFNPKCSRVRGQKVADYLGTTGLSLVGAGVAGITGSKDEE
ncbi:hypothetical protein L207DRAFT_534284 [Hyaloscypha variabilis F]|uniref:Uncharacterized protein n=1 Tax=Hyaloscypha variabilis (strain UAMH 11265 / GT02V1 / F) TaxID=1149755 RepID=A0A2J6R946_HYAVF|nr:hypothetical protein L207DRAFT_534284 [Hyaloscypha variabilis F]